MIVFLTTVLVLLCLLVILLILIQRTSGGMGSALGGGAADQVLGAGSAAQLSKITVYGILGFFVLSFALYAFYQKEADRSEQVIRAGETPSIESDQSVGGISSPEASPGVPSEQSGSTPADESYLPEDSKLENNATE